jgi:hypothetical protein
MLIIYVIDFEFRKLIKNPRISADVRPLQPHFRYDLPGSSGVLTHFPGGSIGKAPPSLLS